MTKVLFLDVDGVLNRRSLLTVEADTFALCPKACARLKVLVAMTGARIVLSSSWRSSEQHISYLRKYNVLEQMHDDWQTKEIGNGKTRGDEIDEWLSRHPEVTQFAIVDDVDDFLPKQRRYFVHTSYEQGLLDKHVKRLAAILGASQAIPGAADSSRP